MPSFGAPFPPGRGLTILTTTCTGVLDELGPHALDLEEVSKTLQASGDTCPVEVL